jgi:hypothetical protein
MRLLLSTSSSDALSDNILDGQPNLTYDTLRGYFTSSSDALPVNILDGHLRIDAIQGHDVAHSPGRREMYHSLLEAPSSRVRRSFAIYNNWQSSHELLTLPQGSSHDAHASTADGMHVALAPDARAGTADGMHVDSACHAHAASSHDMHIAS